MQNHLYRVMLCSATAITAAPFLLQWLDSWLMPLVEWNVQKVIAHGFLATLALWASLSCAVACGTAAFFDAFYIPFLVRHKLAVRISPEHTIKLPARTVALQNLVGSLFAAVVPCAIVALFMTDKLWTVHMDYSLSPLKTVAALLLLLLLHDTYYYFVHRWLHANLWLYRHVHADHHGRDVMLEARTGLFISAAEALVLIGGFHVFGLVMTNTVVFGFRTPNFWGTILPIFTTIQTNVIGHTGLKFLNPLPLLLVNPLLAVLMVTGTAQSPQDHQTHHEAPRYNMAAYFRHWDDLCGTAAPVKGRTPSSMLLVAWNVVFYGALLWGFGQLGSVTPRMLLQLLVLLLVLALLPPGQEGGWCWLQQLGVWDRVRRAYGISIHTSQPFKANRRYIFAYHPHGVLARGWWLTFGLQGKESPVATTGLRVKLGTHRMLLRLPVVKQALSMIGCCAVDKSALHAQLTMNPPTSVTVCPGGWAEGSYAGTHSVLLAKRLGFVELALKCNVPLVPVLGLGEERLGKSLLAALLLPAKSSQLKVVFGAPVIAQEGEGVQQLHNRYVAALLDLAKQHGVELQVE